MKILLLLVFSLLLTACGGGGDDVFVETTQSSAVSASAGQASLVELSSSVPLEGDPSQTGDSVHTSVGPQEGSGASAGADTTSAEQTVSTTQLSSEESRTSSESSAEPDTLENRKSELRSAIARQEKKPNELGELPIVLYHHIGGEDSLYYRSVASFRKDLQALYDRGYRAVPIADYIESRFDLPAGTTPVVLTFDDGTISHFKAARDADGNLIPDPNCAVGVLDAFCREHPDFGRHAVFYINRGAFAEPEHLEWKLRYLQENGYEIGNHTYGHTALDGLDAQGMQEAIGRNANLYAAVLPELRMTSLAYPYGNKPRPENVSLVFEGEFEGRRYAHGIGLIAGWCPTRPLYAAEMRADVVHRVQGGVGSQQLDWWLAYLDQHPEKRFISDGDPEVISIPERLLHELDESRVDAERLLIYPEE